jgi:formylglycine-generating enzyme required for sulfatase activity
MLKAAIKQLSIAVHGRNRTSPCASYFALLLLFSSTNHHAVSVRAQDATAKREAKEQERPSPPLPEEQRADSEAVAKADRAIADFSKGNAEALWRTLRRNADPATRAYVIDRLPSSGAIQTEAVMNRLHDTEDAGERAALILSLGGFTEQQLPEPKRKSLAAKLIELYRNDPDSEVHSAIDWLLRHKNDHPRPSAFFQEDYPFVHSNEGASQPRPEWEQRATLETIDRELTHKSSPKHRWFINSEGHTMVVIHPAGTFQMGSPPSEPRRDVGEGPRTVRIPRNFAISTKEISITQFKRYLNDTGRISKWSEALKQRFPRNTDNFTAWPENPQLATIWYDAAAYCNWLSRRDGIPHEQWVYPDEIGPGMVMPADYLHRTGYRLPTEAEWEFAARAGTQTVHFFGDGVALLDRYVWFIANSENHGWPVGMTKPNQYGLFDMYGNAWEWVQDRYIEYPTDPKKIWMDNEDTELTVTNDAKRIRRGGSYSYDKETTRSAHRGAPNGYQLNNRMDSVGFRVACTLPN